MLELYGHVLRPFLLKLSWYVPIAQRPKTNEKREEERQKISEKKRAKELLKEYDKMCKKR